MVLPSKLAGVEEIPCLITPPSEWGDADKALCLEALFMLNFSVPVSLRAGKVPGKEQEQQPAKALQSGPNLHAGVQDPHLSPRYIRL